MDEHELLVGRFEANRTHLRAVAYRMLGSISEYLYPTPALCRQSQLDGLKANKSPFESPTTSIVPAIAGELKTAECAS